MNKSSERICLFLIFAVFAIGCSTKRNTFVSRQYHDVTAYFNVLFNGRDSYNKAAKRVEAMEPEAFDEILPVFAFEYQQAPGTVVGEMQRAIDKANKTIQKHSITVKPKNKKGMSREQREFYNKREFNIFIDDAQLLTGKSNLYLHEYSLAEEKFIFINSEYHGEESTYEARLWQAVVDVRTQKYTEAEDKLRSLNANRKFPDKLRPLLEAAYADLYIKQKKYPEAIKSLKKALEKTGKKTTKIRYYYIIAQLNQRIGNKAEALEYYSKVLKKNPPYFTAFNAEMAMAFSYDSTNRGANIRKTLEKALNDQRNDEYHDQIYYALAKIEESSGNPTKAAELYRKSISVGGTNSRQKGQSYLALADYYLKKPDYVKAYLCYDSAARTLSPEHSMHEVATSNALKLRKLAVNIQTVQREDSLQRLALMPENERNRIIDEKVKKAEESKRAEQNEEQRMLQSRVQADRNAPLDRAAQQASGQWYFNNTTALTLGRSDFEMRWGKRKLEDNWRRRDRSVHVQNAYDELYADEEVFKEDLPENPENQNKTDKEKLQANIPVGDEAKRMSDEKIAHAMFNIGEAYRDDLKDFPASIKAMEDLNTRFPENSMQTSSYVALYELFTRIGENDRAAYYKNLMLTAYPNDPQVLATTDPAYADRMKTQEEAESANFNQIVTLYSSNRKAEAHSAAAGELSKNPKGRLAPQYALLLAISDDYAGNAGKYKNALEAIIAQYPKSAAAGSAKTLLEELSINEIALVAQNKPEEQKQEQQQQQKPVQQDDKTAKPQSSEYSKDEGAHFFIVVLDAKENVNKLQFNVVNFNADQYLNNNYNVETVDFDTNKLLICGKMKDKKEAIAYYRKITSDGKVFKDLSIDGYAHFVISETNLKLFQELKSPLDYAMFFNENYF
ncbi:MAG: tetratricopeptide repeat protein [Prevotellaceae bacterium]|nr:tetratricopeptide repeat protein [Prevotellaceae bacterium]